MHNSGNTRLLASVDEACEALRVRRTTLNRLMREGRLPRIKIGRRTLLPISALDAFVAQMQEVTR